MNIKLLTLLLFVTSVNVIASQTYHFTATVKHNDKILISSKLKLIEGHWEQVHNDNCTYSSKVSAQPDKTLLIENDISCGDFFFYPSFTLCPEGGESTLEIGEVDDIWRFAVSVSSQR